MKINNVTDFNLKWTLESGQSFRWHKIDDAYFGVVEERILKVQQRGDSLIIDSHNSDIEPISKSDIYHYLDLNRELKPILLNVKVDAYIERAINHFWGMRLLNQELWETIASFIISQNNNMGRIRRIIRQLAERFGHKLVFEQDGEFPGYAQSGRLCYPERSVGKEIGAVDLTEEHNLTDCGTTNKEHNLNDCGTTDKEHNLNDCGTVDYTFPTPQILTDAGTDEIFACGTGYRARYLYNAAKKVTDGELQLDKVKLMAYPEAKSTLMELEGIGEKVADCICLFSLGHLNALPVDVWIKRIFERIYLRKRATYREIQEFARTYFGEYVGYAQQYLFHYAQSQSNWDDEEHLALSNIKY